MSEPIITFNKVNKWYGNDFHVLRDADGQAAQANAQAEAGCHGACDAQAGAQVLALALVGRALVEPVIAHQHMTASRDHHRSAEADEAVLADLGVIGVDVQRDAFICTFC